MFKKKFFFRFLFVYKNASHIVTPHTPGWLYPNPKDHGLNKLKDVVTDNANTQLTPSLPNCFREDLYRVLYISLM